MRQVLTRVAGGTLIAAGVAGVVFSVIIAEVRHELPSWLSAIRWGISLVLIWLGIAQIGLLTQGWELIQRSRATIAGEPETLPA